MFQVSAHERHPKWPILTSIAPSFVFHFNCFCCSLHAPIGHILVCFLGDLDQSWGTFHIICLVPKCDRHSSGACTPCASDPMHVTFHIPCHVIIDHMRDPLDVQSTSAYISGKEEPTLARGKFSKISIT